MDVCVYVEHEIKILRNLLKARLSRFGNVDTNLVTCDAAKSDKIWCLFMKKKKKKKGGENVVTVVLSAIVVK